MIWGTVQPGSGDPVPKNKWSWKYLHHLVARPVLIMNSGIHHQANGAQLLVFDPALIVVRVLVEPDLFPQLLGIQRPKSSSNAP